LTLKKFPTWSNDNTFCWSTFKLGEDEIFDRNFAANTSVSTGWLLVAFLVGLVVPVLVVSVWVLSFFVVLVVATGAVLIDANVDAAGGCHIVGRPRLGLL